MSLLEQAKDQAGELLVFGFIGHELPETTSAFIAQAKIGGVILSGQNYECPTQLASLINSIQQSGSSPLPLWIAVDHGGGSEQRFKAPFTRIPHSIEIAQAGSPMMTFEISKLVARELKAIGINVNLAPIADIVAATNGPLASRCFGSDEPTVSKNVSAWVRGHTLEGVIPCVRHFPGMGHTSKDPNIETISIDLPRDLLLARDLNPFIKAFKSKCPWVMTSHAIFPSLDLEFPATLSRKILSGLLREQLRYSKLIISDDLEMTAITRGGPVAAIPILALEAGCDLLLYKTEASARSAYMSIQNGLDTGKIPPQRVLESVKRAQDLKRELLPQKKNIDASTASTQIGTPEHLTLIQKLVRS